MSAVMDKPMIDVFMETDGKEVIATGQVHAFGDYLKFNVQGLGLTLEFINNGKAQRIEPEVMGDKELKLKLYNFTESLGTGVAQPMEIGTLKGRKYYVAFTVFCMKGATSRRVSYTFYLGDRVDRAEGTGTEGALPPA